MKALIIKREKEKEVAQIYAQGIVDQSACATQFCFMSFWRINRIEYVLFTNQGPLRAIDKIHIIFIGVDNA